MFGKAQLPLMNKQKIIRYLQSVIAIPMLSIVIPLSGAPTIPGLAAVNDIFTQENSVIITQEEVERKKQAELEEIEHKEQALKIDEYFEKKNLPLAGYGEKFIEEAVKNDIDPFLLPAIAMRESTGGKYACKKVTNSVFGWGSCKIGFESINKSIEVVAKNLGGNNPNTDHHYEGKTTEQILRKYNSYIKNYPAQVMKIMEEMKNIEIK